MQDMQIHKLEHINYSSSLSQGHVDITSLHVLVGVGDNIFYNDVCNFALMCCDIL